MSVYLTDLWLENCGPIEKCGLKMPFNPDGNPLPLVIVGQNGSGKSILLSYIVDALVEFEKSAFQDVVVQEGMKTPYFRMVGATSVRSGQPFSVSLLRFNAKEQNLDYCEKVGMLDSATYEQQLKPTFASVWNWPKDGNHKQIAADKKTIEDEFRRGAFAFFPVSRKETPDWLNPESLKIQMESSAHGRMSDKLGKPFWVETCATENIRWILDVFLDSHIDLQSFMKLQQFAQAAISRQGTPPEAPRAVVDSQNRLALRQARNNVESILREILQDASAELILNLRQIASSRLAIQMSDGRLIPSLQSLSGGQSILFHLFTTIIRYADQGDIKLSINIRDITGIVIVDEVDAHLHTVLQHDVLPKLIKLFPKVQFIVSSHAPLFVLGMEKLFGRDGFVTIELPSGKRIGSERFVEFQACLERYRDTKHFEEIIEQRLTERSKPMILTEGPLDPIYLKTALELLEEGNLLAALDIKFVGIEDSNGTRHGGDTGLNHFRNVCESNPSLLRQPVLLLYDCDTNKPPEQLGSLWVRVIPKNTCDAKAKKGIENLFPAHLFEGRFYRDSVKEGDYGEQKIIGEFDKTQFCKWVCDERKDAADFVNFRAVVNIIQEFVTAHSSMIDLPK